jgi:hypothetical protein
LASSRARFITCSDGGGAWHAVNRQRSGSVYGRVQAERALPAAALTVVIDRIRSDWVGESPLEPATAEEHQRNINAYLVAIQRQDVDAVNQHVRTIGDGHPTDFPSCTTPSG